VQPGYVFKLQPTTLGSYLLLLCNDAISDSVIILRRMSWECDCEW
jgi:hypothetical protein